MKKIAVLLLAVCLLCTACVSAGAENGYTMLKMYLTLDDFGNLGAPDIIPNDENTSKSVNVIYSQEAKIFFLGGINKDGRSELCIWHDVEMLDGLIAIILICNDWDTIESTVENGYAFQVCYSVNDDSQIWLYNSSQASQFVEAIKSYLENN